ncbi:hypothetical protein [Aestuariivivens sediminicola]|uniref:hypothetical protein n=1 Tax=Aestuariivivens sediminicola TaxID=2913560 RepID=UPI001F55B473|nr:hypothetical protein [Aestuariivivens sediminicola]
MKNPFLKVPILWNVVIIIIAAVACPIPLIFGFAHLVEGITQIIEGTTPDHPASVAIQGWLFVIFLCLVGVALLAIAIGALIAILKRFFK